MSLLGGTSHGCFGDEAREKFDHEGALIVAQRLPQAGLGTRLIQKAQAHLHDGPPLRPAVMAPPPTRGGDAKEHP